MLEISLTWGDVLVHSLIALGVAFVVFLFSVLYRHAAPWISDHWARRSVAAARKQIPRLEQALQEYEADFADHRLFLGRIIFKAIVPMILLLSTVLLVILSMAYYVIARVDCAVSNLCAESFASIFKSEFYEYRSSVLILIIVLILEFLFFMSVATLRVEISPEKFRARLNKRIAGLRDRITEG